MVKKVRRNAPCPCGSGLKYKKCCLGTERLVDERVKEIYAKNFNIKLKEEEDVEAIKRAGKKI